MYFSAQCSRRTLLNKPHNMQILPPLQSYVQAKLAEEAERVCDPDLRRHFLPFPNS
jgi:hypothetical protein